LVWGWGVDEVGLAIAVELAYCWGWIQRLPVLGFCNAIDNWSKAKSTLGWKDWVSNKTGHTVRWLRRAEYNKHLELPPDRHFEG
jgi:hypothetical protein